MKENFYKILGFILLVLFSWLAYEFVSFVFIAIKNIDYKLILGMIGIMTTVISSVWIASYNARKAKEKIVYEAHREKKAEIYNDFMKIVITKIITNIKDKKSNDASFKKMQDFLYKFTATIIIYGSPNVINAFYKYKEEAKNNKTYNILSALDSLFLEMRKDLGESNQDIEKNTLMGLYITGGREAITKFKELPFEVKIPNDETQNAIDEARNDINMESTSVEEMVVEQEHLKNA